MKTRNLWLIVVSAVLLCMVGIVWAQSPHFIASQTTATINADGDLVVKFKEAGLGDNQTINYLLSATAEVTCTCVTNSGKCPKAANKVTNAVFVSVPATFNSGKNGTISQRLVLPAPGCPSSDPPTCGAGQHLVLSAINWLDIRLQDLTNDITVNFPDQGATFFVCP